MFSSFTIVGSEAFLENETLLERFVIDMRCEEEAQGVDRVSGGRAATPPRARGLHEVEV